MKATIKKGINGEMLLDHEISRYSISDGRITATLTGGLVSLPIPYGATASITISDQTNGNIEKTCKYVSYNFVVYNNPADGSTVIGDNTMMFEVLDI